MSKKEISLTGDWRNDGEVIASMLNITSDYANDRIEYYSQVASGLMITFFANFEPDQRVKLMEGVFEYIIDEAEAMWKRRQLDKIVSAAEEAQVDES